MNKNLIELESLLLSQRLTFKEFDTRMHYGAIGKLFKNGEVLSLIFEGSFHIKDFDVAINEPLLRIIELIRIEFKELTRDNNNRVAPVTLGVEMQKEGE